MPIKKLPRRRARHVLESGISLPPCLLVSLEVTASNDWRVICHWERWQKDRRKRWTLGSTPARETQPAEESTWGRTCTSLSILSLRPGPPFDGYQQVSGNFLLALSCYLWSHLFSMGCLQKKTVASRSSRSQVLEPISRLTPLSFNHGPYGATQ